MNEEWGELSFEGSKSMSIQIETIFIVVVGHLDDILMHKESVKLRFD